MLRKPADCLLNLLVPRPMMWHWVLPRATVSQLLRGICRFNPGSVFSCYRISFHPMSIPGTPLRKSRTGQCWPCSDLKMTTGHGQFLRRWMNGSRLPPCPTFTGPTAPCSIWYESVRAVEKSVLRWLLMAPSQLGHCLSTLTPSNPTFLRLQLTNGCSGRTVQASSMLHPSGRRAHRLSITGLTVKAVKTFRIWSTIETTISPVRDAMMSASGATSIWCRWLKQGCANCLTGE